MPHTLDALKDAPERYASLRYRRWAGVFDPYRQEFAEAVELAALADVVEVQALRWVFHWKDTKDARLLIAHPPIAEAAKPLARENWAKVDADDGLRLWRAMRDGGFSIGKPPKLVRMAVHSLRDEGLTWQKIADELGVSYETAKNIGNGVRPAVLRARAERALVRKGLDVEVDVGKLGLVAK